MQPTLLAKVLVKNKDDNYLILRSSERPENPRRSLQPDLPGGVVEKGETCLEGAVRELHEETGIHIRASDLKCILSVDETHQGQLFRRFIYEVNVDLPEVALSWEHDKYWWMTRDELAALKIREPYKTLFAGLGKHP